ncbi:MAG: TIGR00730 family Rossman fold protein [Sphaerochaetaceae bacterium]|nr:TIGR00730 family Rossman fold protein [Sphaerochaetaceae bacterium]HHU88745.1 TIGR00730 family Rossman fold protein [Spirochaetales bacterium]
MKRIIKNLCVFCGSSNGAHPIYQTGAKELARAMGERSINLIYGGGGLGLMGVLAKDLKSYGVKVTGVIPELLYHLVKEVESDEDELIVVPNMHERKAEMYERADAFIVLPGGIGTLEEFLEVFTWLQLGYHHKPIGILNSGGYYNKLLSFLEESVATGFLKEAMYKTLVVSQEAESLIEELKKVEIKVPLKIDL